MSPIFKRCPSAPFVILLGTVLSIATGVAAQSAASETPAPESPVASSTNDLSATARRTTLGLLDSYYLDVELNDVPFRRALEEFAQILGVPVIGHFGNADTGLGIDGDRKISMRARNARARDVLEFMIAEVSDFSSCTWQMQGGSIEVGTKWHLAFSADARPYATKDLLMEPPTFIPFTDRRSNPYDINSFEDHEYRSAALRNGEVVVQGSMNDLIAGRSIRETQDGMADELTRGIAELIEPGNWDFKLAAHPKTGVNNGEEKSYHSASNRIARIRWTPDNLLIVRAPDFIHRQINGGEEPIPPAHTSLEGRDASTAHLRLVRIADDRNGAPMERTQREFVPQLQDGSSDPVIDGWMFEPDFRPRVHDLLQRERMSFAAYDVTARQAFELFQSKFNVPLIVRFSDDAVGFGIEPRTRVTVDVQRASALTVLETLLAACEPENGDCAWQVRAGYLEAGTESRLSMPAARVLRFYDIQDLMLPFDDGRSPRQLAWTLALHVVQTVVEVVEPGAWDYGQLEFYESTTKTKTVTASPTSGSSKKLKASEIAKQVLPRYREPQTPAIIRQWKGLLMISAPNYIHRQVGTPMSESR